MFEIVAELSNIFIRKMSDNTVQENVKIRWAKYINQVGVLMNARLKKCNSFTNSVVIKQGLSLL